MAMQILVTDDPTKFSDAPISGAFPCRKFQLPDGRWCFHCEEHEPSVADVLAIVSPTAEQQKAAASQAAKDLLAANDPASIRSRANLRLLFRLAKSYNALLANAAAGRTPTPQQVSAWAIPGTGSFDEFKAAFGDVIDGDVVNG